MPMSTSQPTYPTLLCTSGMPGTLPLLKGPIQMISHQQFLTCWRPRLSIFSFGYRPRLNSIMKRCSCRNQVTDNVVMSELTRKKVHTSLYHISQGRQLWWAQWEWINPLEAWQAKTVGSGEGCFAGSQCQEVLLLGQLQDLQPLCIAVFERRLWSNTICIKNWTWAKTEQFW